MQKLTPKQEAFCKAIAIDDMNYSDAYRKAYDTENMSPFTINEKASRLKDKDKIATRINELRKMVDTPRIMNARQRRERLSRIAENSPDENAQMKAIDLLNKMDGEYVTKIDADVNADVSITIELSDDD